MSPARSFKVVLGLKLPQPIEPAPDAACTACAQRWPELEVLTEPFDPANIPHLEDAEVLYSYVITPAILNAAPKLRWFHSVVTGPDAFFFPELAARGLQVTSPRGVYSTPIAEWCLGMMIALSRRFSELWHQQSLGRWGAAELLRGPAPKELQGSTVMIIGMGGIGTEVARRSRALGMYVIGVTRDAGAAMPDADESVPFASFRAALGKADVLVLACPLTKETAGMIGAAELAAMKRTALLLNPARGGLVDERALAQALAEGTIAAAAADAFSVEPLPEGNPLYRAPHFALSPHVSGVTERFWERAFERFEENLRRYREGKQLIGEVDFKRGY